MLLVSALEPVDALELALFEADVAVGLALEATVPAPGVVLPDEPETLAA